MKPYISAYHYILKKYQEKGKAFSILHLSDEYGTDFIDYYNLSMCKKVYRNYTRAFPESIAAKIVQLPLGYSKNLTIESAKLEQTRTLSWSLFATAWHNRHDVVKIIENIQGTCEYKLFPTWNDPEQLDCNTYSDKLYSSIFVPCVRGNNLETFRFYEALECGAIPIYVKEENDPFFSFVSEKLPIIALDNWHDALHFMKILLRNREKLMQYRTEILQKWKAWKEELKEGLAAL